MLFGYSLGFSSPALPSMEGDVFHDVSFTSLSRSSEGRMRRRRRLSICLERHGIALVRHHKRRLHVRCIYVLTCMTHAGAFAGGRLLETLGRRGALLYVSAPAFVVGWSATAVATSPAELIAARLVCGFGVGVASVHIYIDIYDTHRLLYLFTSRRRHRPACAAP